MIFERIKSEGLAHNSYLIASGGSADVIDPRRDCEIYLDFARKHGLRIRHIFETHRNEDYVIGSLELAEASGADIYHGAGLKWGYGQVIVDGQEISLGSLRLTALRTPGHTDESMSYALCDLSAGSVPVMVFTGDALFVGDTGRIDLYGPEQAPRLALSLYDSIFSRILPLGDGVILCPAHGAGSVCGRAIANRDESTLGIERLSNPALQAGSADQFVKRKLSEKLERPYYFSQMEKYNLEGAPLLGCFKLPQPLNPGEFEVELERGALLIDTREPPGFGGAHIKAAYSIWLDGLPGFAGWVLPCNKPVLLVLEDEAYIDRAYRYLLRLGYDRVAGYLRGGMAGWYNAGLPVEKLPLLSVHELREKLGRKEVMVLDVRREDEWEQAHIEGAAHIFVGELESKLELVRRDKPVAVICNVGHRAGLGASILLRAGFPEVYNVLGSMQAWLAAGYPVAQRQLTGIPDKAL